MGPKKMIFLAAVFLVLFCQGVFAQDLVCDLAQGQLNGLKIGMTVESGDVERAIGKEPDQKKVSPFLSDEYVYYYYFQDGIQILAMSRNGGPHTVRRIDVYLRQWNREEGSYNKFPGTVTPSMNGNETMETIKEKIGPSDPSYLGSVTMGYKTSYGHYDLKFDENGLYRAAMVIRLNND